MKVRNIFDPTEDKGIDCSKSRSLTKQADKDSCDINLILRRYEQTGILPDLIQQDPRYGDFSSVPSYQEALEVVCRAQEQFEALDARTRDRFGNDPVKMLAFCEDKANLEEMVKLGLAVEKAPPSSQPSSANTGLPQSSVSASGSTEGAGSK